MTVPRLTVASANLHCGVDGWGRPFDVVADCAALDADVLVLQESWAPDHGGVSTADLVASRLGYHNFEVPMARGHLAGADPAADHRWGPGLRPVHQSLQLEGERRPPLHRRSTSGRWGIALLTRPALFDSGCIPLGKLRRDPARRVVLWCSVALGDHTVSVLGTHMSHVSQGSLVQYRTLRRVLCQHRSQHGGTAGDVLLGDMNLWGPVVVTQLPGWRRAVVGRTWPTDRPHSQLDHILVSPGAVALEVVDPAISPASGADHRPVRATLLVPPGPAKVPRDRPAGRRASPESG